jgi:hypothetical protein
MKSATRTQLPSTEQLTLLPATSIPARFRLSKDTRERGLRHVAEIRQMLAARSDSDVVALPRHDQAA